MSDGRVFQAVGAVTLNACLPNLSVVLAMSGSFCFVDGRLECLVELFDDRLQLLGNVATSSSCCVDDIMTMSCA